MDREEFLKKCKNNFQECKKETAELLINENQYTMLYIYKLEFYEELFDLLSRRQFNTVVQLAMEKYGNCEKPLEAIFNKYLSVKTEPKLLSETKLFNFLIKLE